ncbi:MAG: hypothetical protein K8L91_30200 [Anaerolineae bacterium]|nr:hypothetical protein [Anaerolineae bacterium]
MRKMRWLIAMMMLILGSLACFATAEDGDDSSLPMSTEADDALDFSPMATIPTLTPGPSPTPYPTTDPAQNEAFDISTDADESGGISAVVPMVGLMGLAFGAFVGVIWYKGRGTAMRRRKSG